MAYTQDINYQYMPVYVVGTLVMGQIGYFSIVCPTHTHSDLNRFTVRRRVEAMIAVLKTDSN